MTHYIALIHKDADSGYGVSFPDVPGVTAVADTLDEALREASVALAFAFEDWQGHLPSPRTLDVLRQDAD
ncbi:type II toxin-antitoxin system HicB family antitoxin [Manganibacter manganicus]|uniref:type II toxin-antitoxin system HicB family antitoxin n=1 Tax=Manganibacter manganicus TaxID=1873176 RepID=UPI0009BA1AC5|nr:type II toxin-antitoxin system HicB family antitoxin [Pseudaminobacter manganicus]